MFRSVGRRVTVPSRVNRTADTSSENAILSAAAAIVADTLAEQGHALAAPVTASFRTARSGSCGVALTVELKDPLRANATLAAIRERFGGDCAVDVVSVT